MIANYLEVDHVPNMPLPEHLRFVQTSDGLVEPAEYLRGRDFVDSDDTLSRRMIELALGSGLGTVEATTFLGNWAIQISTSELDPLPGVCIVEGDLPITDYPQKHPAFQDLNREHAEVAA